MSPLVGTDWSERTSIRCTPRPRCRARRSTTSALPRSPYVDSRSGYTQTTRRLLSLILEDLPNCCWGAGCCGAPYACCWSYCGCGCGGCCSYWPDCRWPYCGCGCCGCGGCCSYWPYCWSPYCGCCGWGCP